MTDIGILGAGNMGKALARLFLKAGHRVKLSNSRNPSSLEPLVAELGRGASAGTGAEAARFGDVVILATRWDQKREALRSIVGTRDKILVDTTNPYRSDGTVEDLGGRGSSEVVAEMASGAHVVKAFNHQPIASLDLLLGPATDDRYALFISGDDAGAKATVARLLRDIGAEPFDVGTLREGGKLQGSGGGPLAGHGRLLKASEARALVERLRAVPRGAR